LILENDLYTVLDHVALALDVSNVFTAVGVFDNIGNSLINGCFQFKSFFAGQSGSFCFRPDIFSDADQAFKATGKSFRCH